jgi:acyl-CoA thioester hydrolase
MIVHETNIRVCYGDTDMMGVVYYGTYARFYEIARTELLRAYGITYKEIEEAGLIWPVRSFHTNYIKPAYYDDLLTVRTMVDELPAVRFKIKTEIYNEQNELINHGEVVLISTSRKTGRPIKTPGWLLDRFREMISDQKSGPES